MDDQDMIIDIARNDSDPDVRLTAVQMIQDQTVMADIAREDPEEIVRKRASQMLKGYSATYNLRRSTELRIRREYSVEDFQIEPESTRRDSLWDFCGYLEDRYDGQEFGYEFPDFYWDPTVLETIFATLKDAGYIRKVGYRTFALTGRKREDLFNR